MLPVRLWSMEKKYFVDVVINKETLSAGEPVYVAHCASLGIASQGKDAEEAMKNIREAVELYLEEMPEKYELLAMKDPPLFSVIEVTRNAKAASIIG
jgi:predicted RNase H-like HicB family nuclease